MGYDEKNGKPVYRMRGGRFTTYGVRIWPEMLQLFGINTDELKPGPNPITPTNVFAELTETGQPRKVIGRAP